MEVVLLFFLFVVVIIIFIIILLLLYRFQVDILFTRHVPHGYSVSCSTHHLEHTNNKPFTEWIGLTHVTNSRAVAHKSWMARCPLRSGI